MRDLSRIHRGRIYTGVALLCAGVLLMLAVKEDAAPLAKAIWMTLVALGAFFYIWGRYFSRGGEPPE